MADNETREEVAPRGNEWEVVSLTASAYAAAPGPDKVGLTHDSEKNISEEDRFESSSALFMSGHFVFPPSQHENLPLEPLYVETHDQRRVELDAMTAPKVDDEKPGEIVKGLVPNEFSGLPSLDDRCNMSGVGTEFEKNIQDNTDKFDEPGIVGVEPDDEFLDPRYLEYSEGKKLCDDDFPCESWWKKKAISVYSFTKETNAFWSIFVAATVMGLVILRHRWQQESWQVLQFKRLGLSDEWKSRVIGPLSRLKDMVVSGHRHSSFLHGATSNER